MCGWPSGPNLLYDIPQSEILISNTKFTVFSHSHSRNLPYSQVKVLSLDMRANLFGFSHVTVRTVPVSTGNVDGETAIPVKFQPSKLVHSEKYYCYIIQSIRKI